MDKIEVPKVNTIVNLCETRTVHGIEIRSVLGENQISNFEKVKVKNTASSKVPEENIPTVAFAQKHETEENRGGKNAKRNLAMVKDSEEKQTSNSAGVNVKIKNTANFIFTEVHIPVDIDRTEAPRDNRAEKDKNYIKGDGANKQVQQDTKHATFKDDIMKISENFFRNSDSKLNTILKNAKFAHPNTETISKDGDTEDTMNMILLETETKESMLDVKLLKFHNMPGVQTNAELHCAASVSSKKHCNDDLSKEQIDVPINNATSLHFQGKKCTEKENINENRNKLVGKDKLENTNISGKKNGQEMKGNVLQTSTTETIRVVLIGQTGAGKSSTGNTLLGAKRFKASPSSKSCTEVSQRESTVTKGLILEVLDTPGLLDTDKPAEELRNEFLNCMTMTNPGPHAFLLIMKMNRVTDQEKKALQYLKEIFGGDQFLRHTIIVITKKRILGRHLQILERRLVRKSTF